MVCLFQTGKLYIHKWWWCENTDESHSLFFLLSFFPKTGLSPLAPGQWPKFLGVYAGFWVVNNFLRPARVAAAVAISTQFENIVNRLQSKFRVNKAVAVGMVVFFANVVGTLAISALGIVLASTLVRFVGVNIYGIEKRERFRRLFRGLTFPFARCH